MAKGIALTLVLVIFAGCSSAPMTLPDYYATIIQSRGIILGIVQLDGHLFFIGAVPEGEWSPPRVESTQS